MVEITKRPQAPATKTSDPAISGRGLRPWNLSAMGNRCRECGGFITESPEARSVDGLCVACAAEFRGLRHMLR